jgi:hypothetical protein
MYDNRSKRQASILAQLRTDMTPLNGYFNNIRATETNLCECREAPETRKHFIFYCVRWSEQRKILDAWAGEDHLSRLLGGKATADADDWKPDMDAVRAVIHLTLATKRFEHDVDGRWRTIGASTRIDAYTAALVSIAVGLGMVVKAIYAGALSPRARGNTVHVFTNNRTVLITLRTLGRRSRQAMIGKILKHVKYLEGFSNRVVLAWAPVDPVFELVQRAKQLAQRSTEEGRVSQD